MLAFSLLAAESRRRSQDSGELRFLLLAGAAACRAGWQTVPRQCRERALEINPHHMLSKYDSFEAALRDEDFKTFLKRLDRFCTFEMAETLLENLHPAWQSDVQDDLGGYCVSILTAPAAG